MRMAKSILTHTAELLGYVTLSSQQRVCVEANNRTFTANRLGGFGIVTCVMSS